MKITDKSQPDQTWDQKNPESEQLLRASEQHYQTLARISPVGIFHTDPNGFTRYVNPKWCAISGFSPEQALGDGGSLHNCSGHLFQITGSSARMEALFG